MKSFTIAAICLLALSYIKSNQALPRRDSTLIVGGVEVSKGEIPWMVDIRRLTSHSCGASIVNENWVVTAAHCTQGAIGDYTLVAGDHDNTMDEGTEQRRSVSRIVNHPSYRPGSHESDISLMRVSEPFVFNSRVKAVDLPESGLAPTSSLTAAGWGRTTDGGSSSRLLLKVVVPFVSDTQCRAAYGADRIADHMICAGQEGKDACQGDSGGPLICYSGSRNYLCGIVSWGTGCARPQYPGVYTETSYFTTWIQQQIIA
ncbi:Trypsin-1 [Orchesella cincta]|uniref:Phenoloxidase-activating factor 2 n=1 Tax=Orchesella cincta TaxID=48709 RepID=A0A1D2MJJ8_ORCCI|nr:Trypsin-1 [Orchesella cincta]